MKNAKKLLALLTAAVLTLALCVPTFAVNGETPTPVEQYTISVPSGDSHSYEVYQIFTGDLSDGKLSNVVWGTNGNGTVGAAVPEATLEALAAVAGNSYDNKAKLAVIETYANLLNPVATVTASAPYTAVPGYYLIKDVDSQIVNPDVFSTYIVEVVEDTPIARKADIPTVTKVADGKKVVDKAVGDTVTYTITATLPANLNDFNTYYLKFTDTLSKGLDLDAESINVTVAGTDFTKYFYKDATTDATSGETSLIVSIADILDLSDVLVGETGSETAFGPIPAASTVVLTYDAVVNTDAVIDGANENEVDISYSNNPNKSGTPDTDDNPPEEDPDEEPDPDGDTTTGVSAKSEADVYTTKLIINKVDDQGQPLAGAEFELTGTALNITKVVGTEFQPSGYVAKTGETILTGTYYLLTDGTYTTTAPSTEDGANNSKYASITDTYVCVSFERWVNEGDTAEPVKGFVDASGVLSFTGLKAGTYTLTETTVPAGYNAIDPITIEVAFDEENEEFYITALMETMEATDPEDDTKTIIVNDTSTYTMTYQVVNKSGVILPETGGIGTTVFYVLGSILLLGAAVMLITKKRMGARG